jgi:hypothetical protein
MHVAQKGGKMKKIIQHAENKQADKLAWVRDGTRVQRRNVKK